VQVADQMREAVLSGELAPGTVLPSERELCEQFEVSRTSVREALRALQAEGFVSGAGANAPLRVAGPEALAVGPRQALERLQRMGRVPLSDLLDMRCALEAAAVESAARRLPRPDLAGAQAEIDAMHAAADDVEAFEQADVRFHLALAAASGNQALQLILVAVRDSIAAHLLDALHAAADPPATIARLTGEHKDILAAVEEREPDRARHLMREHILGLYQGTLD
jgi:DNA-binding FadR family transcriptional regulator